MDNVTVKLIDGMLHLIIDPKQRLGQSKSGKSTTIASSRGNKTLILGEDSVTVSVNVYN